MRQGDCALLTFIYPAFERVAQLESQSQARSQLPPRACLPPQPNPPKPKAETKPIQYPSISALFFGKPRCPPHHTIPYNTTIYITNQHFWSGTPPISKLVLTNMGSTLITILYTYPPQKKKKKSCLNSQLPPSPRLPVSPSPRLPVSPSPRLPVSPSPRLPVSVSFVPGEGGGDPCRFGHGLPPPDVAPQTSVAAPLQHKAQGVQHRGPRRSGVRSGER